MVALVLTCHLTLGQMLLCKLPAHRKVYRVVIDTGSNVTSFVRAKPFELILSNGKRMKIRPRGQIFPLSDYNSVADPRNRIDGIIGQDVLSRFQSVSVDYRHGTVTLMKSKAPQRTIPGREGKNRHKS